MRVAGLLITVEGVEGSGKTTQCRLLAQWLRGLGYRVRETSEPDGTPLGVAIRDLFEQDGAPFTPLTEAFLFMAARQQHVAQVIKPAVDSGEIIVSDRYADATLAYQGYGRGLDLQTIRELNALATGGVLPDLTLVLDLDAALGLKRLGNRARDAFEKLDFAFHHRVRQGYLEIAREEKDRIAVLDADRPEEPVHAEIRKAVGELLRQRGLAHGV
ncbi:MAG: dTMP kinase [Candidatus Rokubacteria bacterium]|nr:dTMP kinase [Candidatus Rokubacteria bacterium]